MQSIAFLRTMVSGTPVAGAGVVVDAVGGVAAGDEGLAEEDEGGVVPGVVDGRVIERRHEA